MSDVVVQNRGKANRSWHGSSNRRRLPKCGFECLCNTLSDKFTLAETVRKLAHSSKGNTSRSMTDRV
jgi:hypothetical protein